MSAGEYNIHDLRRRALEGARGFKAAWVEFGRLLAQETEKWGKVVKFSGAKPD